MDNKASGTLRDAGSLSEPREVRAETHTSDFVPGRKAGFCATTLIQGAPPALV